jgi:dTDP-4-dehydrorhamnose 3,5-epimerase
MSRFEVTATPLSGVMRVRRLPLRDERGSLTRMFCARELAAAGWDDPVEQVNLTQTRARGTVRGLHWQRPPHAEVKLVSCLRGEIWDVAVDLRRGSPTFLRWHAEILSGENDAALLIPRGVAHGFQALSDDVEMLYCHSAPHVPEAEAGFRPLDPRLAIAWPLQPITLMSPRDAAHPPIADGWQGVDA